MADIAGATRTEGGISPSAKDFITALLERVSACEDEHNEAVIHELRRSLPAFARLSDAALDVLRDKFRVAARFYFASVPVGRRLEEAERHGIETMASQVGELGLTYDDVSEAMRLGVRRSWLFVVEQAAALPASTAAVEGLGRLLVDTLDFLQDVFHALTQGFMHQQSQNVARFIRAQRELVDDLLSGAFESDEELVTRSRQVGQDLEMEHGLLLIVPPHSGAAPATSVRHAKQALVTSVPAALDGPMRTAPGLHTAVVVPVTDGQRWSHVENEAVKAVADHDVVIVAIEPVRGPGRIHQAYVEAARHVPLVSAASTTGLVRLEDLAVYRVLASAGPDEGKSLLSRTLGPLFRLTENRRETLLETLDALWANEGRVVDAADDLAITERALRYRIRRLHELTGLDPDNPADRLQLDLARHALRLYPDHLVPERRGPSNGAGRAGQTTSRAPELSGR